MLNLAVVLVLFSALIMLAAVISMIRPLRVLRIRTRRQALLVFLGAFLGMAAALVIVPVPPATDRDASSSAPASTAAIASAKPTKAAEPAAIPEDQIRDAVYEKLRKPTVIEIKDGTVRVQWEISENLTANMTKRGAQLQLKQILEGVQQSSVQFRAVNAEGSYNLVDVYGQAEKRVVVEGNYSKETLDKINWESFLTDNVYRVADSVTVHPAFQP